MASHPKGTVTSLSSMFPSSEARKASQLMHDHISQKQLEIQSLNNFVSDNSNLINLVQRLPDELHHDVMVPFGKAAFFPGRLVHTNEFTVLLGEGYYAERTAKQTVDILRRRGKTLESQIDSLKAIVEDIKAKASFFYKTAEESEEGLVEIREEYTDEDFVGSNMKSDLENTDSPSVSEVNKGRGEVDDEEYSRIMSRFDELEKEELEAEEKEEEDDHDEDSTNSVSHEKDHQDSRNQCHIEEITNVPQPSHADMIKLGKLSLQPEHKDESSRDKDLMQTHSPKPAEIAKPPSILKSGIQSSPKSSSKVAFQLPKPDGGSQISRPMTDSLKAFTGMIVERTDNLQPKPEKQTSQPSSSQPTKPMSRFKMQRR